MAHYFTNDQVEDHPFDIHFDIQGKSFTLHSNYGVFSKEKLDEGTRLLLENVIKHESNPKQILDLGCGIGPVGIVLATFFKADITMFDINARAVELAKKNAERYGISARVEQSDGIRDGQFDCIVFNPPIRVGKKAMYALFDQCIDHLKKEGRLWIVMRKQHGAESAMKYFKQKSCHVERIDRDKGYWIIRIERNS